MLWGIFPKGKKIVTSTTVFMTDSTYLILTELWGSKVYQLWSSSSKAKKPLEIKTSFEYMVYLVIKDFLNVEE